MRGWVGWQNGWQVGTGGGPSRHVRRASLHFRHACRWWRRPRRPPHARRAAPEEDIRADLGHAAALGLLCRRRRHGSAASRRSHGPLRAALLLLLPRPPLLQERRLHARGDEAGECEHAAGPLHPATDHPTTCRRSHLLRGGGTQAGPRRLPAALRPDQQWLCSCLGPHGARHGCPLATTGGKCRGLHGGRTTVLTSCRHADGCWAIRTGAAGRLAKRGTKQLCLSRFGLVGASGALADGLLDVQMAVGLGFGAQHTLSAQDRSAESEGHHPRLPTAPRTDRRSPGGHCN